MGTVAARRFAPPGLRAPSFRFVSLIVAAAWVVHELRVVVGYGADAGRVLAAPGHEYLPLLAAVALVLIAVAGARWCGLLLRAAAGRHRPTSGERASPLRAWGSTAAALVGVYLVQAGLESLIDPTHPILAHGGWAVVPIAMAVAAVVVLLLRGADGAVERLARRGASRPVPSRERRPARLAPVDVAWPPSAVLARHLAGRAPPSLA
jgi:hypothetical protein